MSGVRIVIEHPGLDGARAVVPGESLPTWEARGFVPLGESADGGTETSVEAAARVAAEAERLAAVVGGLAKKRPAKKVAAAE